MAFFTPNIGSKGRWLRGMMALLLLFLALLAVFLKLPWILPVFLGILGLFCGFEALRGWCVARACGIRTKI